MKTSRRLAKTFQNDHQNEQQGHSIQIPLPLHLDTSNRTNHVPLNSNSIAVSAADSRSMILSLENNVNVVSNIIRDSENLVKIKCGQCRKVSSRAGWVLIGAESTSLRRESTGERRRRSRKIQFDWGDKLARRNSHSKIIFFRLWVHLENMLLI